MCPHTKRRTRGASGRVRSAVERERESDQRDRRREARPYISRWCAEVGSFIATRPLLTACSCTAPRSSSVRVYLRCVLAFRGVSSHRCLHHPHRPHYNVCVCAPRLLCGIVCLCHWCSPPSTAAAACNSSASAIPSSAAA